MAGIEYFSPPINTNHTYSFTAPEKFLGGLWTDNIYDLFGYQWLSTTGRGMQDVNTAHNVLDDGTGNATIAGQLQANDIWSQYYYGASGNLWSNATEGNVEIGLPNWSVYEVFDEYNGILLSSSGAGAPVKTDSNTLDSGVGDFSFIAGTMFYSIDRLVNNPSIVIADNYFGSSLANLLSLQNSGPYQTGIELVSNAYAAPYYNSPTSDYIICTDFYSSGDNTFSIYDVMVDTIPFYIDNAHDTQIGNALSVNAFGSTNDPLFRVGTPSTYAAFFVESSNQVSTISNTLDDGSGNLTALTLNANNGFSGTLAAAITAGKSVVNGIILN